MKQDTKQTVVMTVWAFVLLIVPYIIAEVERFNFTREDWSVLHNLGYQIMLPSGIWIAPSLLLLFLKTHVIVAAFCATWLTVVASPEYRKWIYPVALSTAVDALTVIYNTGTGLTPLRIIVFYVTCLVMFRDNRSLFISVTAVCGFAVAMFLNNLMRYVSFNPF